MRQDTCRLERIAGPDTDGTPASIPLEGEGLLLGRASTVDLLLADPSVSRRHARLVRKEGAWHVVDEGSSGGTMMNGARLAHSIPAELDDGDTITIGPWTFRFRRAAPFTETIALDDTRVRPVASGTGGVAVAMRHLGVLGECLERMTTMDDEAGMARVALESVLRGTRFRRGAILRTVGDHATLENVLALERGSSAVAPEPDEAFRSTTVRPSRSLVDEAARGEVAVLSSADDEPPVDSATIIDLRIHSALCAPIRSSGALHGFLYLDSRGDDITVRDHAVAFCAGVARAYGLALANARRAELERRQQVAQLEIERATEVRDLLMPEARGANGAWRWASRMDAGLFISGDLCDVVAHEDGSIAACLGDVAGHGLGPAMLAGLTQTWLRAETERGAEPGEAAARVNRFLARRAKGRFVSAWIAQLDVDGTVSVVDAGHGHWIVRRADAIERSRRDHRDIPLGIDPRRVFQQTPLTLAPGDRVVVVSDGILEQRDDAGEEFGIARLQSIVAASSSADEDVQRIHEALRVHAGGDSFIDDVTILAFERIG